jgi:hypothetical protein
MIRYRQREQAPKESQRELGNYAKRDARFSCPRGPAIGASIAAYPLDQLSGREEYMTFGRHIEKVQQISAQKPLQARSETLPTSQRPAVRRTLGESGRTRQYRRRTTNQQGIYDVRLGLCRRPSSYDAPETAVIVMLSAWLLFAAVWLFLN